MTHDCGCCGDVLDGSGNARPYNPPGLKEIAYRVGTRQSFLDRMLARLSELERQQDQALPSAAADCWSEQSVSGVPGGRDDPARALLDAWACVGDVLSFYQERIANEAYLRTATEERSVREMGRLLGYRPRPGVAASVLAAFTVVAKDFDGTIPRGTKLQSTPRPGADAQIFETSGEISGREEWNAMRPLARAPGGYVRLELIRDEKNGFTLSHRVEIFVSGIDARTKEGDVVLLRWSSPTGPETVFEKLFRVSLVTPAVETNQTTLRMVPLGSPYVIGEWGIDGAPHAAGVTSAAKGARSPKSVLAKNTDVPGTMRVAEVTAALSDPLGFERFRQGLDAELRSNAFGILQRLCRTVPPSAFVFRSVAQPFGFNSSKIATTQTSYDAPENGTKTASASYTTSTIYEERDTDTVSESPALVFLDGEFSGIDNGAPVVVVAAGERPTVSKVLRSRVEARAAYDLNGKVTRVELDRRWWPRVPDDGGEFETTPTLPPKIDALRNTLFYVDGEPLSLLNPPLEQPVSGDSIYIEGDVRNLPVGRWLIVEGLSAEPETLGLAFAEAVRVTSSAVESTSSVVVPATLLDGIAEERLMETRDASGSKSEGDTTATEELAKGCPRTLLRFTPALSRAYERKSMRIYGNVVEATHGETREQVLGSGNASVASQRFELQGQPLTFVAAATPTGTATTLEVRVNDVRWTESSSFRELTPHDEAYLVRSTLRGKEEIVAGDGVQGMRLPTGTENVRASYRVGLGTQGNIASGTLTSLLTRPMGVSGVNNPLAGSGGADADALEEMRARVPIVARGGEDRLVSVADYAEYASNFAGVMKAEAEVVPERGTGQTTIVVTIAGPDPKAPILPESDLFAGLLGALLRYGDPLVSVSLRTAEPVPLALGLGVRVVAGYRFDLLIPKLRFALLAKFGWRERDIGQAITLAQLLAAAQAVPGVQKVDVERFEVLTASTQPLDESSNLPLPDWSVMPEPHQVLYLGDTLPNSLALVEVK